MSISRQANRVFFVVTFATMCTAFAYNLAVAYTPSDNHRTLTSQSLSTINSVGKASFLNSYLWDVVASGGNRTSNGDIFCGATAGQTAIGVSTNGQAVLSSGFWQPGMTSFLCGDADGSNLITISDAVYLINYIFSGGPAPVPLMSGDADCNGTITVSDVVFIINYIFGGGPAPCETCE